MGNCSSTKNKNEKHVKGKENIVVANNLNKNNQGTPISKPEEQHPIVVVPVVELAKPLKIMKIKFQLNGSDIHSGSYPCNKALIEIMKEEIANKAGNNQNKYKDVVENFHKYELYNITNNENLAQRTEESLETLFPNTAENVEVVINIANGGLDISPDIKASYYKMILFGSPKYETKPFEVIVYNKTNNILNFHHISTDDHPEFINFSQFSAYCNGGDKLFISGGDKQTGLTKANVYLDSFMLVNLALGTCTKLPNLKIGRYWHSMLFIPEKFIFLVGGINTKSVELYNLETNEITIDSELNENRSEASLCCVDNTYLYAFCGFKYQQDYSDTIERCNLTTKLRQWEYVKVQFTSSVPSLDICYFAITYNTPDTLLFLGGTDKNSVDKGNNYSQKNYIFNTKSNEIALFDLPAIEDICYEKFFIPTGPNSSILIPGYNTDYIKVLQFIEGNMAILKFDDKNETTFDDMRNDHDAVYVPNKDVQHSSELKHNQFTFDNNGVNN